MTPIKRVLLVSAAMLFLTNCALPSSNAAVRLALIADKTSELNKSLLVSLLEVELSQKEGIQLLERAAIDEILSEQKLSAAGLLDRDTAIKLGKLLRADAFLILSLENRAQDANDLIRVRFAETAHGLRLLDYFEQSNGTNPQEAVAGIIQKTQSVIGKITQPAGKLIPVGIVDIHRVQLGEQYRMLERTLPVMLSVRLSLEPQIIMLEREDLKVLLDEKLMTEGEDSQFWNSAILIEGYLQPKNGRLEMHMNLKQAGGDNLKSFIVQVEPNEPLKAIAQATTEIIQELQNSPPAAKWQPEQEAEEFYKQGRMLAMHSRFEDAMHIFETVHALQPQNVYYTGALLERIWEIRLDIVETLKTNEAKRRIAEEWQEKHPQSTMDPPKLEEPATCPYSDMEIVQLVSMLVRQIHDSYNEGLLSRRDIHDKFSRTLGHDLSPDFGYFMSSVSADTEQIRRINRQNRKIWIETYSSALKQQSVANGYSQTNSLARLHLVWLSSDEPNELLDNLKRSFTEFIMPPELGGIIQSAKEREENFDDFLATVRTLSPRFLNRTYLKNASEDLPGLLRQYLTELDRIENQDFRLKIDILIAQGISSLTSESEKLRAADESLKKARDLVDKLLSSDGSLESKARQELILNVTLLLKQRNPTKYIGSFDERFAIWEKVLVFLIEQKDIDSLSKLATLTLFDGNELKSHPEINVRRDQLFEQMLEMLENQKGDKQIGSIIGLIKDQQALTRRRLPGSNRPETSSALAVTILLKSDKFSFPSRKVSPVLVQDKMAWISMMNGGNRGSRESNGKLTWALNIGLAGIDLERKELTTFWQREILSPDAVSILSGLCIGTEASYVSMQGAGIAVFPGTGTEGQESLDGLKILTQDDGLPSLFITSMTMNEDKLWVAYGWRGRESGLGIYDPETGQWQTVFCSTLKEDPPFSAGVPYKISSLTFAGPEKLYFIVSGIEQSGLWEMDVKSQETKYCRRISGELSKDFEGNIWLQSINYLCRIDDYTEKIIVVIRGNESSVKGGPLPGLEEDMFLPESFLDRVAFGPLRSPGRLDISTGTIYSNRLWAIFGNSQLLTVEKGASFEDAQIMNNSILGGERVRKFVSTHYGLLGIGEGVVGLIDTESLGK